MRLEACDVSDRADVTRLLTLLPEDAPLTGVVHAAGCHRRRRAHRPRPRLLLDTVLRPKADGAWHLHRATAHHDPAAFVLFSSAAGAFGAPGQANYAAANAFLDGLAAHRHALGLPAVSIAWGPWADDGGMTSRLSDTDRGRLARGGVRPLAADEALALLDEALTGTDPAVIAVRTGSGSAGVRALLRPAPTAPARRTVEAGPAGPVTSTLLDGATPEEGRARLLGLVRDLAATVLGHPSSDAVEPDRLFTEQGFDSLTVVELRNHLASATGLRLTPTLLFDHATPRRSPPICTSVWRRSRTRPPHRRRPGAGRSAGPRRGHHRRPVQGGLPGRPGGRRLRPAPGGGRTAPHLQRPGRAAVPPGGDPPRPVTPPRRWSASAPTSPSPKRPPVRPVRLPLPR